MKFFYELRKKPKPTDRFFESLLKIQSMYWSQIYCNFNLMKKEVFLIRVLHSCKLLLSRRRRFRQNQREREREKGEENCR